MSDRRALGIFSWFGYDLPLAERLKLVREAGFSHTCIWWGEKEELYARGERARIPQLVRESALTVTNMHVPYEDCNQLWSSNRGERQQFVERHLGWLEDCARHGIECMVLHVSRGAGGPGPTGEGLAAFRRIVEAAERRGVTLAIENTRRDDIIDCLLGGVESPRLGLCYDSSHANLYSMPATALLRRWGRRLVETHFSDNHGEADDHMLPGAGNIDWKSVAEAFPQSYTGCIMLECEATEKERESRAPLEYLQEARRRAEWLAGMLGE